MLTFGIQSQVRGVHGICMVHTRTQQMEAKLDVLLKMFEADRRTVEEQFVILDESIVRLETRLSECVEQIKA